MDRGTNRVAIVTGASRGIGRATARALAAAGLQVYLVADGAREELEAGVAECTAAHPAGLPSHSGMFDLARTDAAQAMVDAALAAFGRLGHATVPRGGRHRVQPRCPRRRGTDRSCL